MRAKVLAGDALRAHLRNEAGKYEIQAIMHSCRVLASSGCANVMATNVHQSTYKAMQSAVL